MDYREFMQFAPKDCRPTVVDTKGDLRKNEEKLAKELGKKVEELTEDEEDKALAKMGLCPLDFMD